VLVTLAVLVGGGVLHQVLEPSVPPQGRLRILRSNFHTASGWGLELSWDERGATVAPLRVTYAGEPLSPSIHPGGAGREVPLAQARSIVGRFIRLMNERESELSKFNASALSVELTAETRRGEGMLLGRELTFSEVMGLHSFFALVRWASRAVGLSEARGRGAERLLNELKALLDAP